MTSGVHMWNGTAATLKANPIASSAIAARASAIEPVRPPSAVATGQTRGARGLYAIATPYRKNAEENAPRRKYFIAPSTEPRRADDPVRRTATTTASRAPGTS